MTYINIVKEQLRRHEGVRSKLYKCTANKWSIGIGRNLEDVGLRPDEIEYLFDNDVAVAEATARKLVRNFDNLSDNRKAVVVNLSFNMGESTLSKFVNTLAALNKGNYEETARGLENSLWYRQVGNRAKELVDLMRRG